MAGAGVYWFIERREVVELSLLRSGLRLHPRTCDRGYARSTRTPHGSTHAWVEVAESLPKLDAVPEELRQRAEALLDEEHRLLSDAETWEALVRQWADVAAASGAAHLQVFLRQVAQRVMVWADDRQVEDSRSALLLELTLFGNAEARGLDLWRCLSFRDERELSAAGPQIAALIEDMAQQLRDQVPAVAFPSGEQVVVFPPGAAAASFFHEVCGHPLEGDVVARGASYLARKLGQQIAEPFLTVSDDPTEDRGSVSFRWDDEGVPAQSTSLIRQGRIDAPLLDEESARALGRSSNGHGRRVSFRHAPLPRMAHTRVEPHTGGLETCIQGVRSGLLVQHLNPRHMHLLSGDFSFYVTEAREIRDGRLGKRLNPGILSGNGLEALAAIDFVGSDSANLFATRGCRKLDHGPLPISFGLPSVRFTRLITRAWR